MSEAEHLQNAFDIQRRKDIKLRLGVAGAAISGCVASIRVYVSVSAESWLRPSSAIFAAGCTLFSVFPIAACFTDPTTIQRPEDPDKGNDGKGGNGGPEGPPPKWPGSGPELTQDDIDMIWARDFVETYLSNAEPAGAGRSE